MRPDHLSLVFEVGLERRHVEQAGDRVHARHHRVQHRGNVPGEIRKLGGETDGVALHRKGDVEQPRLLRRLLQVLVERVRLCHNPEEERLDHHVVCEVDELRKHGHLLAGECEGAGALECLLLDLLHRLALLALVRRHLRRLLETPGRQPVLRGADARRHVLAHLFEERLDLVDDVLEDLERLRAHLVLGLDELLDSVRVLCQVCQQRRHPKIVALLVELQKRGAERALRQEELLDQPPPDLRVLAEAHVLVPQLVRLRGHIVLEKRDRAQRVEHRRAPPPLPERRELRRLPRLDVHDPRRRHCKVLRLDLSAVHHREIVRPEVQARRRADEEKHFHL
mmetsp:Transcript_41517/g.94525  ORF Transcript_41517/g.94525 Transcript_41517/m.94525 type:complete len:338 (+) Transcript_41517:3726-4739(+)